MKLIKILSGFAWLMAAACNSGESKPASNASDLEHISTISRQYTDSILSLDPESMEMQQVLLHINAGSQRLKERGDTALAEYFREAIATGVAERNPALARRLFPSAPLWD